MTLQTNGQKMAQEAYQRIVERNPNKEFTSFAREFPTLVHTCGLAQAIAFARAKGGHQKQYLEDLAAVLQTVGHAASSDELEKATRVASVTVYLRLSRDALLAAVWLKRYVEAAGEQPTPTKGD